MVQKINERDNENIWEIPSKLPRANKINSPIIKPFILTYRYAFFIFSEYLRTIKS
jgi:hypothetical protein